MIPDSRKWLEEQIGDLDQREPHWVSKMVSRLDAYAAAVLRGAAQEFEQSESNWHGYEAAELLERLAAQQEKK